MFTFLSVIRKNFEYNLRILANFIVKTQNLWNSPLPFQKTTVFFFFYKRLHILHKKSMFYNERCPKFREIHF